MKRTLDSTITEFSVAAGFRVPFSTTALAAACLVAGCLCPAERASAAEHPNPSLVGKHHFDRTISREVLESYLARAITMEGLLNGRGDLDDNIRMLKTAGAKFIGRSLCLWGGEAALLRNLERAKQQLPRVHAADPEMVLQACIFEIVTTQVEEVPVPEWAFAALGQPVEKRNFRYADMLYPSGRFKDHWRSGQSVPDVSRPETKRWFYFLGASFIDVGCEAIHLGQTELMNHNDRNLDHYAQVLALIRSYAVRHARRHLVLLDSHVPSGGLVREGQLLMDFHSFPLRIMEVPDKPQEAILKVGFSDGIYGKSKGGKTFSGWTCERLPFLVEIDNWGVSRTPGQAKAGSIWIWGYDEISWFAHQSQQYRSNWLRYAWDWVRQTDTNGHLQMPGSRTLVSPLDRKRWYYANSPGPAVPEGYGDEEAIRAIWASDRAEGSVETTRAAGRSLKVDHPASTATDYAEAIRRDAPVAWWRFDDPNLHEGAAARDAQAGHDGRYHGALRRGDGPIAGLDAIRFDGTGSYVEVPQLLNLARNAISVEFWFKSTQRWDQVIWPGSATFVTQATAGADSSDWTLNAGSRLPGRDQGLVVASSGATTARGDARLYSRARLNDGQWHHLVWTRSADGANKMFVDGRLADLVHDGGGTITNGRPIQVGGDPREKGAWFAGWLAELAFYDKVLEPGRVQAHFAAVKGAAAGSSRNAEPPVKPREVLVLTNQAGLRWELARYDYGWALGTLSLRGKPVEAQARSGLMCLRHRETGEERWLAAARGERIDARTARFSGEQRVDGANLTFSVRLQLHGNLPAASLDPRWSVDKELNDWEVCLTYHEEFAHDWRVQSYPFVANRAEADIAPMRYCGVPGALLYRPDLSTVVLFALDPQFDYLNPTTWTGHTGFHFKNGLVAPQFRAGGGKLSPGVPYEQPLQWFVSDAADFSKAITSLVRGWIELNHYAVQPLPVRAPAEALAIFVAGRRKTTMWYPGKGYRIQDAWAAIYMPESPGNAYLDYLLYEQTGEALWRQRAFEIMDFFLKAQHTDPTDRHRGAVESHFNLDEKKFASTDRGGNPGLKPDMNAMAARYALMLWQRVNQKEAVDRQDWYQAAVRMADWIMRQQNADGGLPQVVGSPHAGRDISVVSGRALVAFPIIHRITEEARYGAFAAQLEEFLRRKVEGRIWFTGAHTDLPPGDYEADSVWQAVEYWLNKHEWTGDADALAHAEANALLAFLMMCPKQLSWVKNPTQTSHAEQQHYLQYSNYCYTNAKIACLRRLGAFTRRPLYRELAERVMQCGFWAQETSGDWMGCQYERLSDPWHGVSRDYNSKGTRYLSELAVEQALQLVEQGLAKAR